MAAAISRDSLVQRWDGVRWSVVATPYPADSTQVEVTGLSCTSTTFCVAVGNYSTTSSKVLVEQWNGARWSIISTPTPPGRSPHGPGAWISILNAVSCTSATNCTAVGWYDSTYLASSKTRTLVERWNGRRWSIVPSPNPSGAEPALDGVSCTSTTNCIAVGNRSSLRNQSQTLSERWNGKSWSTVGSPNVSGADENNLVGVSCADSTHCMAVGDYIHNDASGANVLVGTLAERWDGTHWSIVPSPNPTGVKRSNYSNLDSVACTTGTTCVAVGYSGRARGQHRRVRLAGRAVHVATTTRALQQTRRSWCRAGIAGPDLVYGRSGGHGCGPWLGPRSRP